LSLSDLGKKLLNENKLSVGQLRPLIGNEKCDELIQIVLKKKLSSREVEKLVKKGLSNRYLQKKVKKIDILNLEKSLSNICGIDVNINFDYKKEKGSIQLNCKSLSEFDYMIEKIKT
jgi:ParB family chromosome partitioning protein